MSTRPFKSLLSSPELMRLNRLANAQRRIEQQWQDALPAGLENLTSVVGVDGDCLVVTARSQALVAKLRQMEARIRMRLAENGLQVNAIRWQVQVGWMPHQQPKPKSNLALSDAALRALDEAATTLPPSPLRDALAAMVAKRRG
ncbi:DciA family protein [Chitinimonas koreensis]|uniref:DciA family protein n=1 Tax=Chitinimonas koreensis TaxID=356302 RepID=UPI0003F6E161|nr:DciA family protein [Chitinimonas koreensis]QNM96910.1 DUF721 domain-containing protein [Chitinimonas koreensis]